MSIGFLALPTSLLLYSNGFHHQLLLHLVLSKRGAVPTGAQVTGIHPQGASMETVPGHDRAAAAVTAGGEDVCSLTGLLGHTTPSLLQDISTSPHLLHYMPTHVNNPSATSFLLLSVHRSLSRQDNNTSTADHLLLLFSFLPLFFFFFLICCFIVSLVDSRVTPFHNDGHGSDWLSLLHGPSRWKESGSGQR